MAKVSSGVVRAEFSEGLSFVLFTVELSAASVWSSVGIYFVFFFFLLEFPRKIRILFVSGVGGVVPAAIGSGFREGLS